MLGGSVAALAVPVLPGMPVIVFLGLSGCLALIVRWGRVAGCFLIGAFWVLVHAQAVLDGRLPNGLAGQDVQVTGTVTGVPETGERRTRFVFVGVDVRTPAGETTVVPRARLNWYGPRPDLKPGERWQFTARLNAPRGYRNPGAFDYETWLFRNRFGATGYVRVDDSPPVLLSEHWSIHRLRVRLADFVTETLGDHAHAGVIQALTVGDRQGISDPAWRVLRLTGTTHLMAISGLHVGALAGLAFLFGRALGRRIPMVPEWLPAPRLGALAALGAAVTYAALAGFAIPTQRALLMLAMAMLVLLVGRRAGPGHVLGYAMIGVLLVDPFAPLAPGFWLSFGAVGVIVYALRGRYGRDWRDGLFGRVHLVAAVGLAPLLILHFGEASVIAPLANLVAVPAVTLGVIPLSLTGTFLGPWIPGVGGAMLALAGWFMDGIWLWLEIMAGLPFAAWQQPTPPVWTIPLALTGALWLLAPAGLPARWLGVVGLLPALTLNAGVEQPPSGAADLTLLDVGNGQALVVRTRDHVLLVDTGPRYSPTFDAGSGAVIPWLTAQGITWIDRVLITRDHGTHLGGLDSVRTGNSLGPVAGPPASDASKGTADCAETPTWTWDGVLFEVLAEGEGACHLRIDAAGDRAVIPGKVPGQRFGKVLRRTWPEPVEVMVVPDRGKAAEGVQELVQQSTPSVALLSVAHRDRWGRPEPELLSWFSAVGARMLRTDHHGAVTVRLGGEGARVRQLYRLDQRRLWHALPE